MTSPQIDKIIDNMMEYHKSGKPNPFVTTRIMQRIDSEFFSQEKTVFPTWMRILQPVTVAAALVIGIIIGAYTARSGQDTDAQAISSKNTIETLRTDFYISELTNEDNILKFNQKNP